MKNRLTMATLAAMLLTVAIPAASNGQTATNGEEKAVTSRAQQLMGSTAPKLAELTDNVLYADIWERTELSKRDRSLITVAALIAMNRPDQLRSHLNIGLQNGLSKEELSEAITHIAFYSGWPNAVTAVGVAKDVFEARQDSAMQQGVSVTRAEAQQPSTGSAANFTGIVSVASRFQAQMPARASGGVVTFEAGARTAWHSHPLGQTLIVTEGSGLVQHWGGEIQKIAVGDVVWIPPGVKHWHGASSDQGLSHVAIAEAQGGKTSDWMEHVSDEQYSATAVD